MKTQPNKPNKPNKPLLGITMGDPAGIGPEVIAKALAVAKVQRLCRPLVIGSFPVMQQTVKKSKTQDERDSCGRPRGGASTGDSSRRAGPARSFPWALPAWSRGA